MRTQDWSPKTLPDPDALSVLFQRSHASFHGKRSLYLFGIFDQLNLSLKADKRERISKGRPTSNPNRPHRQLSTAQSKDSCSEY